MVKPGTFYNNTGTYDLGVAMAAASCIHPSHREFGVTSGRPRVVGFFDCVAHAEVMQVQGPYCSISAFDRGDDYDEYAVCVAYVFVHPRGEKMTSNGRVFASGTVIKAGEQLPTQQILHYCQPIVKKVAGWRDTPIFARSEWWRKQQHPVVLPTPVCELLDIIAEGMPDRPGLPEDAPTMPAFADDLDAADRRAVLAYITTWWTPDQLASQRQTTQQVCADDG